MSNNLIKFAVLAGIALSAIAGPAFGLNCATPTPAEDFLASRDLGYPYEPSIDSAVIKLRVWDVQDLNGVGALSSGEIQSILENLAAAFEGIVEFRVVGIEPWPVDSHVYEATIQWTSFLSEADGDAIDMFLGGPEQSIFALAGMPSTDFPAAFYVRSEEYLFSNVVAHEMGHCLGLYHTHESWFCLELPDQSNCSTCGDLVCDTNADPSGLTDWTDPITCDLLDSFYVVYPDYDPDPTNIMAYAPVNCLTHFTPEQRLRMLAMIEHAPVLQAVVDHPEVVLDNRSSLTGLDYPGQPYSAVGFDYTNSDFLNWSNADLFITLYDQEIHLFECDHFHAETQVPSLANRTYVAFDQNPPVNMRGCVVADFDNDGHLDLFVAGGDAKQAILYRNNGDGTFTDQTALLNLTAAELTHVHAGAWADFDGDGQVDLYLCRAGDPATGGDVDILLRNDLAATGGFIDVSASTGIGSGPAMSLAAAWADVTGNGRPDLYVIEGYPHSIPSQPQIRARLYIHDGTPHGGFSEQAVSRFGQVAAEAMKQQTSIDVADITGNGIADLVIGDGLLGGAMVLLNDGAGYFPDQDTIWLAGGGAPANPSGVRLLDLDRDGRPDLLVIYEDQGRAPVFYRNTTAIGSDVTFLDSTGPVFGAELGATAEGLVSLDWNRDGDPDLFLGRPIATNRFYYRTTLPDGTDHPDQPVNVVRLVSDKGVNNAAGIGARVESSFQGSTLVKWVDGGSGRGGQNELVLTFPVDQASGEVPVTVTWPNGWIQDAEVDVHTPNGAPAVILDDTEPTIDNGTVSAQAAYDPDPGTMILTFTWETDYRTDPDLDKVALINPPGHCGFPSEITRDTAGATLEIERLSNGNYRHTLVWTGWSCVPNCKVTYTVTSAHRPDIDDTSSPKQLKIIFCPL